MFHVGCCICLWININSQTFRQAFYCCMQLYKYLKREIKRIINNIDDGDFIRIALMRISRVSPFRPRKQVTVSTDNGEHALKHNWLLDKVHKYYSPLAVIPFLTNTVGVLSVYSEILWSDVSWLKLFKPTTFALYGVCVWVWVCVCVRVSVCVCV